MCYGYWDSTAGNFILFYFFLFFFLFFHFIHLFIQSNYCNTKKLINSWNEHGFIFFFFRRLNCWYFMENYTMTYFKISKCHSMLINTLFNTAFNSIPQMVGNKLEFYLVILYFNRCMKSPRRVIASPQEKPASEETGMICHYNFNFSALPHALNLLQKKQAISVIRIPSSTQEIFKVNWKQINKNS